MYSGEILRQSPAHRSDSLYMVLLSTMLGKEGINTVEKERENKEAVWEKFKASTLDEEDNYEIQVVLKPSTLFGCRFQLFSLLYHACSFNKCFTPFTPTGYSTALFRDSAPSPSPYDQ